MIGDRVISFLWVDGSERHRAMFALAGFEDWPLCSLNTE